LPTTSERLGAGGGFTNVRAGDALPNSHKTVCGSTPALAPNRLLSAGIPIRQILHYAFIFF